MSYTYLGLAGVPEGYTWEYQAAPNTRGEGNFTELGLLGVSLYFNDNGFAAKSETVFFDLSRSDILALAATEEPVTEIELEMESYVLGINFTEETSQTTEYDDPTVTQDTGALTLVESVDVSVDVVGTDDPLSLALTEGTSVVLDKTVNTNPTLSPRDQRFKQVIRLLNHGRG